MTSTPFISPFSSTTALPLLQDSALRVETNICEDLKESYFENLLVASIPSS